MVEFYLLTFSRFPLRKKEHKSYFGMNGTHVFRTTSGYARLLLDDSGDKYIEEKPTVVLLYTIITLIAIQVHHASV